MEILVCYFDSTYLYQRNTENSFGSVIQVLNIFMYFLGNLTNHERFS